MKKVVIALMFLLLVGGALAMTEPISVKATAGDEVKIYAWTAGGGPLLTMDKGIVDEDGIFETTFFSLSVPARFNIFVIRDGDKVGDGTDFLDHNLSEALSVDCTDVECKIVNETVVEIVNETVVVNETVNDSVVANESTNVAPTGNAIFTNADGSIKWIYSLGGGIVVLVLIVFLALMFHGKKEKKVVDDDGDKELKDVNDRVKQAADKIKQIKNDRDKRENLIRAKAKLAEEEAELRRLEGRDDARTED